MAFYWTTQEGVRLRSDQITDRHLLNIHRYLMRQWDAINKEWCAMATMSTMLTGDGALDSVDASEQDLNEQEADLLAKLRYIESEITRRGLEV